MSIESFIKKIQQVRNAIVFDADVKSAVRGRLAAHARGQAAVRAQVGARLTTQRSPSFITYLRNKKFMPIAALITLLALLGGGTSLAAEKSLPGDPLYAVKVNINEPIAEALTFSASGKAKLDAGLAAKRLAEADALAAQGKLDATTTAELEAAFEASASSTQSHLKDLRDSGDAATAASIGSDFQGVLEAHAKALRAIQSQGGGPGPSGDQGDQGDHGNRNDIEHIARVIDAVLGDASSTNADVILQLANGSSTDAQAIAQARITASAAAIASARAAFQAAQANLATSTVAVINARLSSADNLQAQAQAKFDAGLYVPAFELAGNAARAAAQVNALLNLQVQFSNGGQGLLGVPGIAPHINLFHDDEGGIESEGEGPGPIGVGASSTIRIRGGEDNGGNGGESEGEGHRLPPPLPLGASGTVSGSGSVVIPPGDEHGPAGVQIQVHGGIQSGGGEGE